MQIRAVTGFMDPGWPLDTDAIARTANALQQMARQLREAGYEVQTTRLATPPPAEMSSPVPAAKRPELARNLEAEVFVHGIDYAAIGPVLPDDREGFQVLPEILASTEIIFTSALYADPSIGLSLRAASDCARAIQEISGLSHDGFGNLRFAALVDVAPGTPFFPAAYHRGGPATVAIATEAADLAVQATREGRSLRDIRQKLINTVEVHADAIQQVAQRSAGEHNLRYTGIDFSLAPYPEPGRSIGTAMEALGPSAVGSPGSAAAAAFLADCLSGAKFTREGFCGLFLPVLEDSVLAARAASGQLTLSDLLLYSTLCGTGLDTIPLPGSISQGALTALLVDLGAVGLRHLKPLTARLMPIPGKDVGDPVHFDFPYFADSGIMALPTADLQGPLASPDLVDIGPRGL
jgi:uncharacterized protein (UPF0210 family)